ncbi:tetratricopeptide repeat-containing hybrid sensor histidine kinase/response regulator [Nonlabens xiamenensis]|uniref:tetratricopeptide repeat-containing hybrid sensor histidine kinase/response regulator n=1 Tax=Nonlabens xiamenensis TaxID=2341043 RepID=UPI000F6126D2|nr:response regulator [Nonlabens xiamenensis]
MPRVAQIVSSLGFLFASCCLSLSWAQNQERSTISKDSIVEMFYAIELKIQNTEADEALELAIQALDHAEANGDRELIARSYNAIGNSYQQLKKPESAEIYFERALQIGKELNDLFILNSATNGLAYIHYDYYEDEQKGLDYLKQSLEYNLQRNEPLAILVNLANICNMYLEMNRPEDAEPYLSQLEAAHELYFGNIPTHGEYIPLYDMHVNLLYGAYYSQMTDYQTALYYLEKARAIGEEYQLDDYTIEVYEELLTAHTALDDKSAMINDLQQISELQRILFDREKSLASKLTEAKQLRKELLASEKQKHILEKLSNSQSTAIYIGILSIVLLLLLLSFMYYSYRKWKSNFRLQSQNETLLVEKDNAERLAEMKSSYISRVSHEIRTPLHSLIGITTLLEEEKGQDKRLQSLVNGLKFSGQYLMNIVERVLELREIESQGIHLNLKQNDLKWLMENIVSSFDYQVRESDNQLSLEWDQSLVRNYIFDEIRLSEVMMNLIENAVKFTTKGKIIIAIKLVSRDKHGDRISFQVSDNGSGIDQNQVNMIFEAFNKAERKEINVGSGAGLGLSTVKYLLESMGSEIELETTKGVGSTFYFSLVLQQGSSQEENASIEFAPLHPKKILVVDDNKMSLLVTGNMVRLLGHQVETAENGLIAVDKTSKEHFDLIIMDLNMPVMNGLEASKQISETHPEVCIIGLSATDISIICEECVEAGMREVFNKPITKKKLKDMIGQHLGTTSVASTGTDS